jgi:ribosome-associated toxin RatA of RatAB toxin-antitoxin module
VPSYGDCQTVEIAAAPQSCFDALTDYERLPDWQGAVMEARILARDEQGRGAVVAYEVDARIKTVRYRLRQIYDEPTRVASEYLGGDFRDFAGEWRFRPRDDGGTHAELDLRIDPGRFVPGPVRSAIADAVMRRALRDLKRHVEREGSPEAEPLRRRE